MITLLILPQECRSRVHGYSTPQLWAGWDPNEHYSFRGRNGHCVACIVHALDGRNMPDIRILAVADG